MEDIRFTINGERQKENNKPFTAKEKELLLDEFISWVASKNLIFIGITK